MYGVQHRVAPLRRSHTQLGETPHTQTNTYPYTQTQTFPTGNNVSSQHSNSADIFTHKLRRGPTAPTTTTISSISSSSTLLPRPSQTNTNTISTRGYGYAVPASMQRSQLTIPHTQNTQLADSTSLQATLTQTAQQQKDSTAALIRLVESFQQHEKYLASGTESLSHLTALVNGQHAQVAALHGIAEEMRAMTGAIRDAMILFTSTQQQQQQQEEEEEESTEVIPLSHSKIKTTTTTTVAAILPVDDGNSNSNSNHGIPSTVKSNGISAWQSAATFILGADTPLMTPHIVESDENEENMNEDQYKDEGAAYFCSSQLKSVVLKCGEGITQSGVKITPFVEDDVFSM
ncbi:uncharacterized protein TM35_000132720 [Trypanosoma theileri]|uniref:Uncharacterized protein n=1 Tax=Trypanosoma theileri TaxID=67003 RepID=A0A1X0NXK1_9TRYP|nr:uncharacterized protein TM35_000132720 [Trypanosoma theileri]ORC89268.1 hypothetical protein TM35_000132720 [Trypanosoma theileri]